ncbi:lipopolysaccharide heptosyltransferase I [Ferriphaselus sp. R-1]|uniref:lipopolysaccharide heptosyltransferase I n=1 Tax=Ferriphaselus sp. R-1 TaxID=1485544 RepID=UPI00054E8DE7|nr:lipopolysaccharide heptosyltransferase I [Ferriphaselus sp. R-1]
MRILLVKTSSLGDVLHNLPVVTDILHHFPDAKIDWVVEENFAELPRLHPGVDRVLTVAVRRWRRERETARAEIRTAVAAIREQDYDFVIDTQGLLKSALVMRNAFGLRCGYGFLSAREPLASLFYHKRFTVPKRQHAVERNRQLVAQSLDYELDTTADYGIEPPSVSLKWLKAGAYMVLLHATSRNDKLWAETSWIELGKQLERQGMRSVLPWGSPNELARAQRLASAIPGAICAPRLDLTEAAALLGRAQAVVGVDTGLAHLAAALAVPTVGIYTATDPALTGLYAGARSINLGGKAHSPSVEAVLAALEQVRRA